jgi:hypothetical protein
MRARTQHLIIVFAVMATGLLAAQVPTAPPRPTPFPRLTPSPVEIFRMLLATNAAGRDAWLATRTAPSRAVIEAKLREYEAMSASQREAKLQASQLRWYLPVLMRMDPADRAQSVAAIPQPDRKLIEQRLARIVILPPPLLNEIVTNQNLFQAIWAAEQPGSTNVLAVTAAEQRQKLEQQYQTWKTLIELSPNEQSRTLHKLSDAERAQMELALSNFRNLSADERTQALKGFRKFAELSQVDRASFLQTAERWQKMTESDRTLWRKIVARMQSAPVPPRPPTAGLLQPSPSSSVATNP